MAVATQFCVGLEDKPGMLAKLCATLREAEVAIEALFVSDDEGCCWVNLLVSSNAATEKALKDGKYNFFTEKVLKLQAQDGTGELERVAIQLAEANVNVDYVYGSSTEKTPITFVLHVSDLDRADKLLKR